MKKEIIDEDEIYAIIRKSGYSPSEDADAIILETDGSLTIIKNVKNLERQTIRKYNRTKRSRYILTGFQLYL